MDTQLCYDCAFKHISAAYVTWCEIQDGYDRSDHYMKLVGNLVHAEEHLIDQHPDLAERIREARKAWWDSKALGGECRPPFEELAQSVWELVVALSLEDDAAVKLDPLEPEYWRSGPAEPEISLEGLTGEELQKAQSRQRLSRVKRR